MVNGLFKLDFQDSRSTNLLSGDSLAWLMRFRINKLDYPLSWIMTHGYRGERHTVILENHAMLS